MSVKTITTIAVAGAPVTRLLNEINRRRGVRAKVEWLLSLYPWEPPVIRHATIYEPWLLAPQVTQYLESVYGCPPIYSPVQYDVFLMPVGRRTSDVSQKMKRSGRYPAQDLWPAMAPILEAMLLREKLGRLAIFTIMKPVSVSCGIDDYDTASAWTKLRTDRKSDRKQQS